jgi:hypothetical protein
MRSNASIPTLGSRGILALALVLAMASAVLVDRSPVLAFALALMPLILFLATRSATTWVASAVVVAVAFRGLVGLHIIPGYAQFIHIPLAWGALCVALNRRRPRAALARPVGLWLLVLAFGMVASTTVNGTEPIRALTYLAILAEPFAIVAALLIDPPNEAQRKFLCRTCAILIGVQVPLAYWQAARFGPGDAVQGTLYGSGAGAHVAGALVIVGAFWYAAHARRLMSPLTIAVLAVMGGVLVVSDAKQVIFALPAAALGQRVISRTTVAVAALAIGGIYVVVHFHPLNSGYAVPYISRAVSGETGKSAVAKMIWHDATRDAGNFVFGQGPAETVSRTAYETVPAQQKVGSSIQKLGLKPAVVPVQAENLAASVVKAHGRTAFVQPFNLDSFDSGLSSGIGLFGDLGVFGFAAYIGLFATVLASVRRRRSPEALSAASGFAMLFVLGFILDWWEAPALTVLLGTLAGLALTARESAQTDPTSGSTGAVRP